MINLNARRGRPVALLSELLIVLLGVILALGADRWNQARLDRVAEGDYLASLAGDLRRDTAAQSAEIARARFREDAARLMLGVVLDGQPIEDPVEFVSSVINAATYGEPVQARETFDDLVATGRLGLIRDESLRRRLTEYYQFVERRSQSYELQRQRVWGDYLPLSVVAVPLDIQEWDYRVEGRREGGRSTPPTAAEAEEVAARLRSMPELETALKGVVRSSWALINNWTLMRSQAESLIAEIEEGPGESRDRR